jgi:hypothetical protein
LSNGLLAQIRNSARPNATTRWGFFNSLPKKKNNWMFISRTGASVSAFEPIVNWMVRDVQERLSFLAQSYIRDSILNFIPTPQDLKYPANLKLVPVDTDVKTISQSWYPTLERTLTLLSKLYLTVDVRETLLCVLLFRFLLISLFC